MHSGPLSCSIRPLTASISTLVALCAAAVTLSDAAAATAFTWDPNTATSGAQDGSGTWDISTTNWWDGAADVLWPNTTTSQAVFGAGVDGTYAVTLSGFGTTGKADSVVFNNSGYTLSAATQQIIELSSTLSTAAGSAVVIANLKTATIGNNVMLSSVNSSNSIAVGGGGTLLIENGGTLRNNGTANTNLVTILGVTGGGSGTTVQVNTGGLIINNAGNAVFVNGTLKVSGGTVNVSVGGGGTLGIGQSTTAGDGSGTITMTAGLINAPSGNGVRFGSTSTSAASAGGTLNLDGGTLSTTKLFKGGALVTSSVLNLNGGTLQVANSTALSSFVTGLGQANVRNGGAIIDSATFSPTISQPLLHSTIAGDNATDGGLTKIGTGTLTLSGANTYTGGTTINGGALVFNGATALPATGMATVNSAGALNATGAFTTVTGWLSSGKITTGSTGAIALTGDSSEAISMGAYTGLSLGASAASSYTGVLTPAGTTYRVGGGAATLTLPNANTLTGNNSLVVPSGTVVLAANNDFTGSVTNNGTLQVGTSTTDASISASSGITNNGTLIFSGITSQEYSKGISGTGALTKQGTGLLILSGNNSYSGATNLTSGALQLANSNALGASSISTASSVQLQLTNDITVNNSIRLGTGGPNFDGVVKNVSGNNTLTNFGFAGTGGVRLNIVAGSSLAITNDFALASGATAQNIRVIGSGTLTLSGNNSSAITSALSFLLGDGTSAGPTIKVGNDGAFGAGTIDFQTASNVTIQSKDATAHAISNPLKVTASGGYSATLGATGTGNLTFTGPVALSGNFGIIVGSDSATLSGEISGSTAAVNVSGPGKLIFGGSAANTYSGGTSVLSGVLDVQKDGGLGSSDVTVSAGAKLTLELGVTNNYISDSGRLLLASNSASVALNFSGADTIASLSFDGGATFAAPGTWGAVGSGATFTNAAFTGTGRLQVIPEPATGISLLGGIGILAAFGKRRRNG